MTMTPISRRAVMTSPKYNSFRSNTSNIGTAAITRRPSERSCRAEYSFTSYHTASEENASGMRNPYRGFGGIRLRMRGTASPISSSPVQTKITDGMINSGFTQMVRAYRSASVISPSFTTARFIRASRRYPFFSRTRAEALFQSKTSA